MYSHLSKTWMRQNLRNEVSTLAPCELLHMSWQLQLRRMVCAGVAGDCESVIRLLCRVVRKPSMLFAMRNATWHDIIRKVWLSNWKSDVGIWHKVVGRHGLIWSYFTFGAAESRALPNASGCHFGCVKARLLWTTPWCVDQWNAGRVSFVSTTIFWSWKKVLALQR